MQTELTPDERAEAIAANLDPDDTFVKAAWAAGYRPKPTRPAADVRSLCRVENGNPRGQGREGATGADAIPDRGTIPLPRYGDRRQLRPASHAEPVQRPIRRHLFRDDERDAVSIPQGEMLANVVSHRT